MGIYSHGDRAHSNREFFNGLYDRHEQMVYNTALKLTQDEDEAKDLLQNVFFKAYRNLDKFEQGTNEAGWLYRMTKNEFINTMRGKRHKQKAVTFDLQDCFKVESANADFRAIVEQGGVAEAIRSLSPKLSESFLLHVAGYQYDEIAKIEDIPEGTVKSRIHKARSKLQEVLRLDGTFKAELALG